METRPVLLALAPDGQRWEDPSEDLLFNLLEDLVQAGQGTLRVERLDSARAETFAVDLSGGLFRVHRQEGIQVFTARSANMREVHAASARWAFRIDGPQVERHRPWGDFDGTMHWRIMTSGA
jgi:hypothetical protein